MRGLQRQQFAAQGVILRVADLRRVLGVIERIVASDLGGQFRVAIAGLWGGQLLGIGHAAI